MIQQKIAVHVICPKCRSSYTTNLAYIHDKKAGCPVCNYIIETDGNIDYLTHLAIKDIKRYLDIIEKDTKYNMNVNIELTNLYDFDVLASASALSIRQQIILPLGPLFPSNEQEKQ